MNRNSRTAVLLPLLLAGVLIVGMAAGRYIGRYDTTRELRRVARALAEGAGADKISYTLSLIDQAYVDPVGIDSIVEQVLPEVVGRLDPHSVYIPAAEMAQTNEPLEGQFDGIGVVFNMATDTVLVLNVIPGGPSDKAGIRAGDRIVQVGDSVVAGRQIPSSEIMKMLRGPRGTDVMLSVQRQGIEPLIPVTVTRGVVPIHSIDAAFLLQDGTAYIKLSAFSRTSHEELMQALGRLRAEGMQALVFDLRGNTGGFLDQAILIANEFLPAGKLIVYTEDRNKEQMREYSDGSGTYAALPLALLIDENSASSSEILAGAMQDNDRALVIGRRSFGKGLVQRQFPYRDGSALRLTVARYFTPTGRSIQKPYVKGDGLHYEEDIYNRYLHDEFFSADSIRFADSLRYTTPGGRTVYGGGGIMPDVFIPLDTTDMSRYFLEVSGRNILYRYTIEYADRHRAALDTIGSVAALNAWLDSDPRLLDDFVAYAARQGVAPDRAGIRRSKALLTAQLRAYIARNSKLQDAGFYANIYVVDAALLRALEEMERATEERAADAGTTE